MSTASLSPAASVVPSRRARKSIIATENVETTDPLTCSCSRSQNTQKNGPANSSVFGLKCVVCGEHCGRPSLLDLFSGAGGAAQGYRRAGFCVLGVDHKHQPRYVPHGGCRFVQGDALEYVKAHGHEFDAIHASPPCQAYTLMRHMGKRAGENAPDLVAPSRDALITVGAPWVMENVVGSPLRNPFTMCGSAFRLGVRRHRLFESSHLVLSQPCCHDNEWPIAVWGDGRPSRKEARREHKGPIAVYGDHPEDSAIHRASSDKPGLTRRAATLEVARTAMGIDWMDWGEITQAIPPAYCEFIGRQLIQAIGR
jgi:DNA (cytosine-5)-methyltransferase 1